jgi:hypothetical protein
MCSKEFATRPCPEPNESSLYPVHFLNIRCNIILEVCTGPDLTLAPRPNPALGPGPGLTAQITFLSGPVSGLVRITTIKRYIEHFGLSGANLFFTKTKLFVAALILCLWKCPALVRSRSDLISSGIFVAAPSQKSLGLTSCMLGIRYLCTFPQTLKLPQILLERR